MNQQQAFDPNKFGNVIGGIAGSTVTTPYTGNVPQSYGPTFPSWETVTQLQGIIMSLQQRIIELTRDVERLKNTKEWLTGDGAVPESPK